MTGMHSGPRWQEVVQGFATVERLDDDGRVIRLRGAIGALTARRATSCLVAPAVSDVVLFVASDTVTYVLAVLDGQANGKTTVTVDGDLEVRLPAGALTLAASESLALATAGELSLVGHSLDVKAHEATVGLQKLDLFASLVEVGMQRAKLVATSVDSVIDRVVQRAKQSYRFVAERDQVRADTIDYAAEGNAHHRGANVLVTAEELVKMDAKQIVVG